MALALQVLDCSSPSPTFPVFAQKSVSNEDWPNVAGSGRQRRLSTDQMTSNVSKLEVAWTFDTEDWSDGSNLPSRSAFEATPLVIDGVMYIPSPMNRLFALNAETGEKLWYSTPASIERSVATSTRTAECLPGRTARLLYLGDIEGRLWAVDAKTGKLDPAFGDAGKLDLRAGMADGFPQLQYGLTSPTSVCGDVVVAGSMVSDGQPRGPNGDVRGLMRETAKSFGGSTLCPATGNLEVKPWEPGSRKDRGGLNVWSFMTVDEARSLYFFPYIAFLRHVRR